MSSSPKQLFTELSGQGPHEVLRGDMALVGLPGLVYTPRTGRALPAVAFGHGLMQPPRRYTGLLRHLASWGIVAAAPGTQLSPLPSHRLFAADLRTTLDICVGVRLGDGGISVDDEKLGVAGHSSGAGAAVLAAALDPRVRAVGTLSLSATSPSGVDAAREVSVPGLHLTGDDDKLAPAVGHAEPVSQSWAGPVQQRTIKKASHLAFTEGKHWSELLLDGKPRFAAQRAAKAMLTALFLVHLAGEKKYRPLLEGDLKVAPIEYDRDALPTAS